MRIIPFSTFIAMVYLLYILVIHNKMGKTKQRKRVRYILSMTSVKCRTVPTLFKLMRNNEMQKKNGAHRQVRQVGCPGEFSLIGDFLYIKAKVQSVEQMMLYRYPIEFMYALSTHIWVFFYGTCS